MKHTRRNKKRGGRIIGEGMQGIAFSPPLECNHHMNPNVILNTGRASPFTKKSKQYVTKVTKRNVANAEMEASEKLRKTVDPYGRFTAPALAVCNLSKNQYNTNYKTRLPNIQNRELDTLVFSRYRGTSILDIFEMADALSLDELESILVALSNLLLNVSMYVNGRAGVLHFDAHPGNIVYDFDTKEASLIDFGFARAVDDKTRERLQQEDYSVKATLDVSKIHDMAILQFFQFGRSPPTSLLMENPYLKSWYASARLLQKNPEATQAMYMDSVKELEHSVVISSIKGNKKSP